MDNCKSIYELSKHSEIFYTFDKYDFYSILIVLYDLVLVPLY